MSLSIVSADPRSVEASFGVEVDLPAVAVLGFDEEGHVVGSGGLAWVGGRCWIFFTMRVTKPDYAVPIFRATKRMLKRAVQLGETQVFTPREADKPRSEKLLRMLGFEMIGHGVLLGQQMEIWRWSND